MPPILRQDAVYPTNLTRKTSTLPGPCPPLCLEENSTSQNDGPYRAARLRSTPGISHTERGPFAASSGPSCLNNRQGKTAVLESIASRRESSTQHENRRR